MFLQQLLLVAGIHLLAVMSPGPDFVLISRNALVYSRKIGIYSALGLALGIMVHITYSLIGIGFLIAKSVVLFSIIKYIGAAYLIYIGYKALQGAKKDGNDKSLSLEKQGSVSVLRAVRMGFLTNVLNPKATLFFLALFTQVITPHTPLIWQLFYGVEMVLATFGWFAVVATAFSVPFIRTKFRSIQYRFEQIFGVILIVLGVKVALLSQK